MALQGLGNTTLFCGDGINDLAALSAADVGMAVGATDAIVAASLSTHRSSVAGLLFDPCQTPLFCKLVTSRLLLNPYHCSLTLRLLSFCPLAIK